MKAVFSLLIVLFLLAACRQQTPIPTDLVAQVNDAYLVKNILNNRVPSTLEPEAQLSMKKVLIKKWVDDEVLYQTALMEGFQLSKDDQNLIESYAKSLTIQRFMEAKLNKNYIISEKDIEDTYNKYKSSYIRDVDEVRLIHLFTENYDKAIFSEIKESADLQKIIKKYYFDNRSTYESPNGDLGYVAEKELPDFIRKQIPRLKTGAISKSIKSEFGYHFIQILDKQKSGTVRELELVKDEIVRQLKWQKREQERTQIIDELKANFQVQTYLSKVQ